MPMIIRRWRGNISGPYPRIGPVFYASGVQYFVVQLVVALHWSPPYSISRNTISDLGNTACGAWNGRYVCSPLHDLMNWSFIVLGVTMTLGSVFIYRDFAKGRAAATGLAGMAASGLGVKRISLNFAVFRAALERGERIGAGPVLRAWRSVLIFMSKWFQIESLYKFNAKFCPVWQPRFFVFPSTKDAPRIALAALEAEAFLVWPRLELRRIARKLGLLEIGRKLRP